MKYQTLSEKNAMLKVEDNDSVIECFIDKSDPTCVFTDNRICDASIEIKPEEIENQAFFSTELSDLLLSFDGFIIGWMKK